MTTSFDLLKAVAGALLLSCASIGAFPRVPERRAATSPQQPFWEQVGTNLVRKFLALLAVAAVVFGGIGFIIGRFL